MRRFLVLVALCAGLGSLIAAPARADILISIDKSSQRMTVMVDGRERYYWQVSTGVGGGPPSGTYRPERLERKWYSRKYNWSPMPHAIFFHEGYAIHGTYYVSRLGTPASHGCVRLLPSNAAELFALVSSQGMGHTRIVVSGSVATRSGPSGFATRTGSSSYASRPGSSSYASRPSYITRSDSPRYATRY